MAKPKLETGSTLDGFTIGPLVHQGGMAILWEVTKPGIAAPMLMKVPLFLEGEDPAAIVSFEMEQMILPRLAGPHVPACFGTGDFAVQPYLVVERIPGEALLAEESRLPMSAAQTAALGIKIAEALESIHRQQVVHLDVKPANIMFRPSGECVLIDFGLAHHASLPDLMAEEFRLPYGTAPYMAPEQILGIRGDPRSDLFALGVLLYYLMTGKEPFGDPQHLSGLKRRLWRDPVPPRAIAPQCPPWLQEIILHCLEVQPSARYATAGQLAFDLRNPDQVQLTSRAQKLKQGGFLEVLRRRFDAGSLTPVMRSELKPGMPAPPIVLAAIDLSDGADTLESSLRTTVARILDNAAGARLACLNVLKTSRLTLERSLDEEGHSIHVQRLVQLKHWAEPLRLSDARATFHVIESPDPAAAILEFSRQNNVDHIVMGARANSAMRSLLGSVSAEVAGHAPCTVTVVREHVAAATNPDFTG